MILKCLADVMNRPPQWTHKARVALSLSDNRWPVCTDPFKRLSSLISPALWPPTVAVCYSGTNSEKSVRSQQVYALQAQDLRQALAHRRARPGPGGGRAAPPVRTAHRARAG